ncbi:MULTISPECIES: hypothetical protein [Brevibacillus]|uniref:hypothetical protein n=1 Tax=Brevibacillus TaxID=55080 RepID=UPI000D0E6732|nr:MULTISPECIES: hypothetical protein [Brevibacillus]PSJ70715.1 hypothetical protein C7J99_04150 [Brevibacillus brevis]RED31058.1 hypothetical protein DES34_104354 [Brevibacillus brevis]TQK63485.1 hypothetical protein FB479_103351 [Brevibacillus sp. AG162]VEF89728.1 Uncharacterised protein [Brevibacillus brevis]GEC90859.1 hypothetical protein BBR01nite_31900 [Brevibacillus brevis]
MTKRLKRTEFMMAYMIIITLACTVGGFFFGAHYMKTQLESEQAAVLEAEKKEAEKEKLLREQKLYNEQDFIRFYYAVYAPMLDLKQAHFDTMDKWNQMNETERTDGLKQLSKLADQTRKELEKNVPLPTSPMLRQAHTTFTNSVRAYLDSMEQIRSDQNNATPASIGASLTLFQNNWLTAQEMVYHSIASWESAYVVKQAMPKQVPEAVNTAQWKQYPFHYRTYLAAVAMSASNQWSSYNPEDLTARLDLLIASNEVQALGIKDLAAAVKILNATDAVSAGDFKRLNTQLYSVLKAPEIPLYK